MSDLLLIDREQNQKVVKGDAALSVMEIIRDAGFDDNFALCGGNCSCATCHVYFSDAAIDTLPPMSSDEDDLLSGSSHRRPTSRLSCQVRYQEALDGTTVTIAPTD